MSKYVDMIEKYIKTLLVTNKRVIIPDFGGFVVKRTASGDVVSFNSFLKFNDDLLLKAVIKGEDIDKAEALKKIKADVDEISRTMDAEGSCQLDGVGYLVRDRKGNVRYMDHLDDSAVPKGAIDKEDEAEPKVAQESVETSKKVPQEKNSADRPWWLIPAIALGLVIILLIVWLIILRPNKVKETLAEKQTELVIEKTDELMTESDSEKLSMWKRLAAAFSKKDKTPEVEDKEVSELETVMKPLQKDIVSGINVVADKYISPKGQERYHVIIGSFSEHKNARKFKRMLVDDGYGAEIFDRYNGFEAVSIGGYPSIDIALRVCGESLEEYPDLWILVK